MKFIDLNYKQFKTTDIARCLKARYTAAPTNHTCEDSSVLIGGGNMKYSPTLNDDSNELAINVIGNYSPSNHNASRVVTTDGIAPTVMENHGTVTAVVVNEPKVIDALYKSREPRESDICPTLRSERTGLLVKESLPMDYDEQDNTLCTDGTVGTLTTDGSSPKHNNRVIVGGNSVRIRRLTPRECWRLQGFPDEYFDKAKAAGISDTQLYKQAGNSVSVPVAKAIGAELRRIELCQGDTNNLKITD